MDDTANDTMNETLIAILEELRGIRQVLADSSDRAASNMVDIAEAVDAAANKISGRYD